MNCSSDEARLTALYADHARPLSRFLAGFTVGSPYGVEDLLQETMIRAWRRIEDVPAEPNGARRWLFAVARNVGIDAIRRARVRPRCAELVEAAAWASADEIMDTVIARDSLQSALDALSPSQRDILVGLHLEGRTTAEVGRRLRLPEGTVKSRNFYAMRSLRRAAA